MKFKTNWSQNTSRLWLIWILAVGLSYALILYGTVSGISKSALGIVSWLADIAANQR